MAGIDDLARRIEAEAEREAFPIDLEVYARAGASPMVPVVCAGSLSAVVCFFGRDLGRQEVERRQPLVGAGGRLIRSEVHRALTGEPAPRSDRHVESVLEHVLLTNTVPYKPPGNKAYTDAVKERFRPFVLELLRDHWTGDRLITLGTEAFEWFARYVQPGGEETARDFWSSEARYTGILSVHLPGGRSGRTIELAPLPHPSPLNRRWLPQLPSLLERRVAGKFAKP
ncbi:MAG: uracil-DNA glycosylase family protein [Isosphaeraceae bacterium]|nr:uracil-DNA glycosylase family protein [Isosphaeraceae bacterium]